MIRAAATTAATPQDNLNEKAMTGLVQVLASSLLRK
jgi:hypothetical protein